MGDSIARRVRPAPPALIPDVLVGAAELYTGSVEERRSIQSGAIADRDLWGYYDTLGEFGAFVDWMARAMSRVRLEAAERVGAGEPTPLTDGPAHQLISDFYGGNQAEFMAKITPHLLGPGECWAVPERFDSTMPLSLAEWSVQSKDTFRSPRTGVYEIEQYRGAWRAVAPDCLPTRIWVPHPRWPYIARSPALAALPIMRRIELIDKRIIAEMLSRLVMNGILWMPTEAEVAVPQKYKESTSPFMAMLIEAASTNVANPGTASAAIPIPVKFPADLIEKIRHDKFIDPMDEHLLAELDRELGRLAQSLPLSAERQAGFKDANHWNGFIVNEDDIKISVAPLAELIAQAVTTGWLMPMMGAAGVPLLGPNGGRIVAWPSYSELATKPDNREAFQAMYDRGEVSGQALRREAGAGDADIPDAMQQREMILLHAVRDPATFAQAYELLTGEKPPQAPAAGVPSAGPADASAMALPPSDGADAPVTPAAGQPEPEQPPATVATGLIDLRERRTASKR